MMKLPAHDPWEEEREEGEEEATYCSKCGYRFNKNIRGCLVYCPVCRISVEYSYDPPYKNVDKKEKAMTDQDRLEKLIKDETARYQTHEANISRLHEKVEKMESTIDDRFQSLSKVLDQQHKMIQGTNDERIYANDLVGRMRKLLGKVEEMESTLGKEIQMLGEEHSSIIDDRFQSLSKVLDQQHGDYARRISGRFALIQKQLERIGAVRPTPKSEIAEFCTQELDPNLPGRSHRLPPLPSKYVYLHVRNRRGEVKSMKFLEGKIQTLTASDGFTRWTDGTNVLIEKMGEVEAVWQEPVREERPPSRLWKITKGAAWASMVAAVDNAYLGVGAFAIRWVSGLF